MKRKRVAEEQIIATLKAVEAGLPVPEVCRKHGISDATLTTGAGSVETHLGKLTAG